MSSQNFKAVSFLFLLALSSSSLAGTFVTCVPNQVGQFDLGTTYSRVHIRCQSPIKDNGIDISFFSLPMTAKNISTGLIDRFFNTGSSAISTGKAITFEFISNDGSGSVFGCNPLNCRRAIGFGLEK